MYWSFQGIFQSWTYGDGSKADDIPSSGLFSDLLLYGVCFEHDRKYPYGNFMLLRSVVLFSGAFLDFEWI